jgi:hypothetical protein
LAGIKGLGGSAVQSSRERRVRHACGSVWSPSTQVASLRQRCPENALATVRR